MGKKAFRFKNKLLTLDAMIIELWAGLFNWARYRQTKGAVKLYLWLDHEGYLPVSACITEDREEEVNIAEDLSFLKGLIIVIDRGEAFKLDSLLRDKQQEGIT